MEKGATITAKYYVTLFDKLRQQLVSKLEAGFQKKSYFFNAAPHKEAITHPKLADLHS
jgi:hypothetical protein